MKKSKISLISMLCLTALLTAHISFASCPAADTIYFFCGVTKQGKTCYWATEDACFQATARGFGAKAGDKAGPFQRAFWSPYNSEDKGDSKCVYQAPGGYGIIELFQAGGYGEVPKPKGSNWHATDKPDTLSCESSDVNDCPFKYCN